MINILLAILFYLNFFELKFEFCVGFTFDMLIVPGNNDHKTISHLLLVNYQHFHSCYIFLRLILLNDEIKVAFRVNYQLFFTGSAAVRLL